VALIAATSQSTTAYETPDKKPRLVDKPETTNAAATGFVIREGSASKIYTQVVNLCHSQESKETQKPT